MAKEYINECVGCPPEMECLGEACPNRNVLHYYCDECDAEEELYYYDDKELCIDCIKDMLEKVK